MKWSLGMFTFQRRVENWLVACFGVQTPAISKSERSHRFVEEALELAQAAGVSKSETLQLVDYVFSRRIGQVSQEVGGVLTTLAAFCYAHGLSMRECGEAELESIWDKIDQIRAKHATKPELSPLPGSANKILDA